MNNENIEIITPKELIKNITKTNTKDDYQQYDNFFTNIDFDKHRRLYKDLGNDNFYDKLKQKFKKNKWFFHGNFGFKDKYKFQRELLEEITKKTAEKEHISEQVGNSKVAVDNSLKGETKKSEISKILDEKSKKVDRGFKIIGNIISNINKGNLEKKSQKKSIYFIYIISLIPIYGKKHINELYGKEKDNIFKDLNNLNISNFHLWLLKICDKKGINIFEDINNILGEKSKLFILLKKEDNKYILDKENGTLEEEDIEKKLKILSLLIPILNKEKLQEEFIKKNINIYDDLYNKYEKETQEILIKLNKRFVNPLILILGKNELEYYSNFAKKYINNLNISVKEIEIYDSYFFILSLILDKRFKYSKFSPKYFFYGKKEGFYDIINKIDHFIPSHSGLNQFKYNYIFHYILENGNLYEKESILRVLKKYIYIDYPYIKENSYGDKDEQLLEKTYKERIYQLLKSDNINEFKLAIDFLIETLKVDTYFIDIDKINQILYKIDEKKVDKIIELFTIMVRLRYDFFKKNYIDNDINNDLFIDFFILSLKYNKSNLIFCFLAEVINKNYNYFKNNFLKYFSKLEINKDTINITNFIEEISKKSLDDTFDMIFASKTGFTEEKEKIKTFIKEYNSGSCLLSGYRGVGKSTLIKSIIEKLNLSKEGNIEYIDIKINIPEQKKDENGITKSFSKKDLMNKIIQQTYLKLKDKGFSSKQLENLQEQYIRTFKQVEEISGYVKLTKRFGLIRTAIEVLKFSIPIGFGLLSAFIISMLGTNFNDFIDKHNDFIDKLKNLLNTEFPNNNYLDGILNFSKVINEYFKFEYIQIIIAGILILLNYLIFRTIFNVNYNAKLERVLYNEDIAEDNFTKNLNKIGTDEGIFRKIGFILKDLIDIISRFFPLLIEIASFPFRKIDKKFIIIIDELDKLLDFDKINKNEDKEKVSSMKDIFEILGKLKTLFFEAENILFFVVSNKEAYDYYLSNKFQEDDMISNIFNKIIYLPMNYMNQFNLNFKVNIKPKLDNDLKEKIKKYLYFKSHGNWRKSNFILGNAIEKIEKTNEIENKKPFFGLPKEYKEIVRINLGKFSTFDFEYKFYDFFDKLYTVFEKGSLDNKKIDEFLFSTEGGIISLLLSKKLDKEYLDEEYINSIKKGDLFYTQYLYKIYELLNNKILDSEKFNIKDRKFKIDSTDLFIIDYLDFIKNKINNIDEVELFSYFIGSIEKISNESSYRDYILNYLLNIYENINHVKKLTINEVFRNLKIEKDHLSYPIFTDLIIFWLPLMLIYFHNIETNAE